MWNPIAGPEREFTVNSPADKKTKTNKPRQQAAQNMTCEKSLGECDDSRGDSLGENNREKKRTKKYQTPSLDPTTHYHVLPNYQQFY